MRRLERRIVQDLRRQAAALLAELPRIREGDADAIHDARVATRRIRAIRSVAYDSPSDTADGLSHEICKLARALGKARDLDVALGELAIAERKLPVSDDGDAMAGLYRMLQERRAAARRRLIKTIEIVPVDDGIQPAKPAAQTRLRGRIFERAQRLGDAMEHATGVYFPNRLHQVRIELKKLRYLIELADRVGMWKTERLLHDLRGVQDVLGTLHDREVLLAHLPQDASAPEIASLRQLVEAERDDLFHQYLSRRSDLAAVVDAAEAFAGPRGRSRLRLGWRVGWRTALFGTAAIAGVATALTTAKPSPPKLHAVDAPLPRRDRNRYGR